jgi:hypothetical protein
MTKDQLFAAMGLPVDTYVSYKDVFVHVYQRRQVTRESFYDGLQVSVGKSSSRVSAIFVGEGNEGYKTSEGVVIGMHERQVRESMGPPGKVVLKTAHSPDMYCYPGLRVSFYESKVVRLSVSSENCAKP